MPYDLRLLSKVSSPCPRGQNFPPVLLAAAPKAPLLFTLLYLIFNSELPQSLTLGSLLASILSPDDFINSHGFCYCQNVKDYKRYTSIPADTSLWAPGPEVCIKLTFIDCLPSALPSAIVHVFNLVSYILSHFILFFVSKYTYINKIYILIKTKMIKKMNHISRPTVPLSTPHLPPALKYLPLVWHVFSFNLHNNSVEVLLSLSPFYRWRNWYIRLFQNLSKISWIVSGRIGITNSVLSHFSTSTLPFLFCHLSWVFLRDTPNSTVWP